MIKMNFLIGTFQKATDSFDQLSQVEITSKLLQKRASNCCYVDVLKHNILCRFQRFETFIRNW